MQLVAMGAQDVHLTGDPKVSFFRSNYQRHTHFSGLTDRQLIQGKPTPGGISTLRFERKGDLLSYVYLTASDSTGAIKQIDWSTVIDKVELLVGGQVIDTQDYFYMSRIDPVLLAKSYSQKFNGDNLCSYFMPLKFFFCKEWQSVLPLIALQYHDIEVRITWSPSLNSNVRIGNSSSSTPGSSLQYQGWARFIFLDKMEREFFAGSQMDLLIEQVQRILVPDSDKADIILSHPVKFLASNILPYTNQTIKQQINGTDVADFSPLPHFVDVPQYYHTPYGYLGSADSGGLSTIQSNVFVVPFCLDTSKLQPTGTLNFSRIDSYKLLATSPSGAVSWQSLVGSPYFYAVNYNILRIQNGMGALLYAN